ncbi:50S ribosomal protein L35 [Planctomycetes bacterium Pla163]|uniref:50S ribosomal protein L35 n=1 Tax=Rohdeia mirabilis TaxID=2528008 RepID=A0A518D080_9BACT|nr:50S ribosomal protein L35 [Planctomycetes bacterium Pla163]
MKSKGSVKKRFRTTKNGKLIANKTARGHMHAPKNGKARRGKRKPLVISGTWAVLMKRMM